MPDPLEDTVDLHATEYFSQTMFHRQTTPCRLSFGAVTDVENPAQRIRIITRSSADNGPRELCYQICRWTSLRSPKILLTYCWLRMELEGPHLESLPAVLSFKRSGNLPRILPVGS